VTAAVVHVSKLLEPDGRLNSRGSEITRDDGCVFRFASFNGSLGELFVGVVSYFMGVYGERDIKTVVLQFHKVSRAMSPAVIDTVIALFLFCNVRFSFHTTAREHRGRHVQNGR
jgi:hypothetical protein